MLCYSSISIMCPCMSLILAHAHFVKRPNLDQHGCRTLHMFCPSLLAILPEHNTKDVKDVLITFVGKSLVVKVIYAELLIVSRVKVRSKTLWQEKLGKTFLGQKFTFIRARVFLRTMNTMSF